MSQDKDYFEKEYDDHVYEDDYYEENYEEELADDDYEDDEEYEDDSQVQLIMACDDCDHRWDGYGFGDENGLNDDEEYEDVACPMCGSVNVEQI